MLIVILVYLVVAVLVTMLVTAIFNKLKTQTQINEGVIK